MRKMICVVMLVLILNSVAAADVFNTTALDNSENIYENTKNLNDLLGGILGVGIIITVFLITFILINQRTGDALSGLAAAGWFSGVTALIFLPLGLIGISVFKTVIYVFAASVGARFFFR